MEKVKNMGMTGYNIFIRPLPRVIQRAVLSYWITIVVQWAVDGITRKARF